MVQKYESMKEKIKDWAKIALAVYVIVGSCANMDKTGHYSADLATGISQPSKLEILMFKSLGLNIEREKH